MTKLMAPTGVVIAGTVDHIERCVAQVESVTQDTDGGVTPNYARETEVNWNDEKIVVIRDELVFMGGNGNFWRESELIAENAEPDPERKKTVKLPSYNDLLAAVTDLLDASEPVWPVRIEALRK